MKLYTDLMYKNIATFIERNQEVVHFNQRFCFLNFQRRQLFTSNRFVLIWKILWHKHQMIHLKSFSNLSWTLLNASQQIWHLLSVCKAVSNTSYPPPTPPLTNDSHLCLLHSCVCACVGWRGESKLEWRGGGLDRHYRNETVQFKTR